MSRDPYDPEQEHREAVQMDLARIAKALERIADKIAPPAPESWREVQCLSCDHFITAPPKDAAKWTENHAAEYGHREFAQADERVW